MKADTCKVRMFNAPKVPRSNGQKGTEYALCGQPVARGGLCEKHADHRARMLGRKP